MPKCILSNNEERFRSKSSRLKRHFLMNAVELLLLWDQRTRNTPRPFHLSFIFIQNTKNSSVTKLELRRPVGLFTYVLLFVSGQFLTSWCNKSFFFWVLIKQQLCSVKAEEILSCFKTHKTTNTWRTNGTKPERVHEVQHGAEDEFSGRITRCLVSRASTRV